MDEVAVATLATTINEPSRFEFGNQFSDPGRHCSSMSWSVWSQHAAVQSG
jgi:hypothetical protein